MFQSVPNLHEGEQVCLFVREHWFNLFLKYLIVAFLFAVHVAVFNYAIPNYLPGLLEGDYGVVVEAISALYLAILVLFAFLLWLFYYLTLVVLTSLRIMDIDQIGLFNHTVAELHIAKVEDVSSKTVGVFGTIFDFGTVTLQSAGAANVFEFKNIPRPREVERLILSLYEQLPDSSDKSELKMKGQKG